MLHKFIKLFLLQFILLLPYLKESNAQTIEEAISLIEKNSLDVLIAKEQYIKDQRDLKNAYSAYYPSVSAKLSLNKNKKEKNSDLNATYTDTSISISQPIYYKSLPYEINNLELKEKAAELHIKSSLNNVVISLIEVYYGLLAYKAEQKVLLDANELFKKLLRVAEIRFESGVTSKIDLLEAKSALEENKSEINEIEGQIEWYELEYERLVGVKISKNIHEPDLEKILLPKNLVTAIEIGLENNIDIIIAKNNKQIYENYINVRKADHFPTVNLDASFHNSNLDPENKTDFRSSLNIDIPIYSKGITSKNVQNSINDFRVATHQERQSILNARSEISKRWNNYIIFSGKLDSLELTVEAKNLRKITNEIKFEENAIPIADVIESHNEYTQSKSKYILGIKNYALSIFYVLKNIGELNSQIFQGN